MGLENFPTNETAQRMMSMLSPIYDDAYVAKWIFQVMGFYFGDATGIVHSIAEEAFPNTATEMLSAWEEAYGLASNPGMTTEERRGAIVSKRNNKSAINPARIEATIKELFGREAKLTENTDVCTYRIDIFSAKGGTFDLGKLMQKISELKQSNKHVDIRIMCSGSVKEVDTGNTFMFEPGRCGLETL